MRTIIRGIAAVIAAVGFIAAAPLFRATASLAGAQERVEVSAEFRTALEPYGEFRQHRRWGEVWVPTHVARSWEPYTVGHWVDSDGYGWYWVSDQAEADWGWVTFHYGRWVLDPDMGWIWIPGKVWGPGFVTWRRGGQGRDYYIGWAPEPPDEAIVEVRDDPHYWVFVRGRDFLAPRIAEVILPPPERVTLIRETVIENRTVLVQDRGFAVNPGISPAIVAAAIGRPIETYRVRPVVLAGTTQIQGATVVRGNQIRQERSTIVRDVTTAQATNNRIRPSANIPAPQPLPPNAMEGRLGANPPRAAQGATTGQAPSSLTPNAVRPQTRPGEQPSQPTTSEQMPNERRGTNGQAPSVPSQPNLGNEQRRGAPLQKRAAPKNSEQTPNERRGTTGAAPGAPHEPNLGNEQRRGTHGLENPGGPQNPAKRPNERRGTTGAAPSVSHEPNLGNEQRHGAPRLDNRATPQHGQLPNDRTTGAAPSGPREPNLRNEQRRGSQGENRAAPHERTSPLRGERSGTSGAAPHEPNLGNERRGPQSPENRAAPHESAAREGERPLATERLHEPGGGGSHTRPSATTGAGLRGQGGAREERGPREGPR